MDLTFIKKKFNFLFVFIIIGIFLIDTYCYSTAIQKSISEKVIRFHVIANSDSDFDQMLKLAVRDEVLEAMKSEVEEAENLYEAENILSGNLDNIKKISESVIKKQGAEYPVNVEITKEIFPFKSYGTANFPKGEYKALKIEIGKGEGKNWWCVVFPALCFTEETLTKKEAGLLGKKLSKEECEIILESGKDGKASAKMKLFIVEKWQELIN